MSTFINKKISKVVSVTQSATPTINADITDVALIKDLAQAVTSFTTNLTGTPVSNQALTIDITDNGTARAITWGTSFEGALLPTTTVASTRIKIILRYNNITSKWKCISVE